MKLLHRSKTPIGEFAVVKSDDSQHQLEINYYPENSPADGPYNTGSEADHLAFKGGDVDEAGWGSVSSGSATHGQLLDAVCKAPQAASYHRNRA